MSRDQRRRLGHSLLGTVVLMAIVLVAAVAWSKPGPPRDWGCTPADTPCMDVNYR